jgi:hypothetical protein
VSGVRSDRGAVTLFVSIAVVGLIAIAGLVVDGGAKVRAVQRADRLAAEAARTAGQAVDLPAAMAGTAVRVDRRSALTAAQAYLRTAGASGSAVVSDDGRSLRVTTSATVATVFLGLVGVPEFTVHGQADVSLVRSPEGALP